MLNIIQVMFPICRKLKIELIVLCKIHFHQVLVANFGATSTTQVMQSNKPMWIIHVSVMIWNKITLKNN
jgi:hypothetical protein